MIGEECMAALKNHLLNNLSLYLITFFIHHNILLVKRINKNSCLWAPFFQLYNVVSFRLLIKKYTIIILIMHTYIVVFHIAIELNGVVCQI